MFRLSCRHWLPLALLPTVCLSSLAAQNLPQDWSEKLINHPLYLRDAWVEDKIAFDPNGKPLTSTHRGPLTLSAINITSVKINSKSMLLRGEQVALIAPAPGEPLKRVAAMSSTTLLPFTVQRQYKANEPVQFTIAAGPDGNFTQAIQTIFADGLPQLAPAVPAYWRCYARTYFVNGPISNSAPEDVLQCAETQRHVHPSSTIEQGFTPVNIVQSAEPHGTQSAAELHLSGTSTVYAVVDAHNFPSSFQVITAVGAGLDEDALKTISTFTFQAATQNGAPISSGFQFSIQYGVAPQ